MSLVRARGWYIYIYVYVCIYIYMYIYICMYIYNVCEFGGNISAWPVASL